MSDKVKIKISEQAYFNLLDLLKEDNDNYYVRFAYKDGCCGSSKINIFIDKSNSEDTIEFIEELPVIYNPEVSLNINEITLVYRNNSFMTKTILKKERDCSSCTVGCKEKDGNKNCLGSCSKCNKPAD